MEGVKIPEYPSDRSLKFNINMVTNQTEFFSPSSSADLEIPLYIYILVSVINTVIFIVGAFGNILVIFVIIRVREMRTPTNVFLVNLSAADVLVLMVCQPAALVEFFGKDRWFFGEIMCKLIPLMENGVLHISILTMLAVTLERYNALCHPFKRRMAYTISSTVKTIGVIWVVGGVLTLPFAVMTELEKADFHDGSQVQVCRTKVNNYWRSSYIILVFVAFFMLPLFIVIGIYSRITKHLMSDTLKNLTKNNTAAANTLRARKQVVFMLIFIIVLFFLSLFPIRVVTLWLIFSPSERIEKLGLEANLNIIAWARILMYFNSAGNPIIYSLTSSKFKTAFRKVLHRGHHRAPFGGTYSSVRNNHVAGRTRIPLTPSYSAKYTREEDSKPYLLIRVVLGRTSHSSRHDTQTDRISPLQAIEENRGSTADVSV